MSCITQQVALSRTRRGRESLQHRASAPLLPAHLLVVAVLAKGPEGVVAHHYLKAGLGSCQQPVQLLDLRTA